MKKRLSKTISMSQDEINKFQAKADEMGISFSALIRISLNEYLINHERNDKH